MKIKRLKSEIKMSNNSKGVVENPTRVKTNDMRTCLPAKPDSLDVNSLTKSLICM